MGWGGKGKHTKRTHNEVKTRIGLYFCPNVSHVEDKKNTKGRDSRRITTRKLSLSFRKWAESLLIAAAKAFSSESRFLTALEGAVLIEPPVED